MDRRQFNLSLAATAMLIAGSSRSARAQATSQTRWSVVDSEGYDALCFWAPLAGEPISSRQFAEQVAAFAPRLDPRARQAIRAVYEQARSGGNVLTHSACRFFSAGPTATIDDLIHSAQNVNTALRPRHMAHPEWEGEEMWSRFTQLAPVAVMILTAMKTAGFPGFRRQVFQSRYAGRTAAVQRAVSSYDAISEVRLLTGRTFTSDVTINLTCFAYPRAMRMLDQEFVTWAGYRDDQILNMSAHELMHPPLDLEGAAMRSAIREIGRVSFFAEVLDRRDPALGDVGFATGLPNYVEECLVAALDQIASDRRQSGRVARDYFSRNGGADVLAACFYGLLQDDSYHRAGGNFEQWVARAAAGGRFAADPLLAAGTRVLGASPRDVWRPYNPPNS